MVNTYLCSGGGGFRNANGGGNGGGVVMAAAVELAGVLELLVVAPEVVMFLGVYFTVDMYCFIYCALYGL